MKAIAISLSLLALPAYASTYYVRTDGGLPTVCDGTTNTPSPAAHCAWSSPMIALPPPPGYGQHAVPRIHAGDTLQVADGSYMIGLGAPGTGSCNVGAAFDCTMAPIPSGLDPAHPTRIIGDTTQLVELWGTQSAYSLFNVSGSQNVEIAGFELTDHSACIVHQCESGRCTGGTSQIDACTLPGTWGQNGIVGTGGGNLNFHDLNIHGLANEGGKVGNVTNLTMTNVKVIGNGFAGWDMDTSNGVSNAAMNHGALTFTNIEVADNGCGERYPQTTIYGCWAQNVGGYGDGFATGHTSGNWTFIDSSFHGNVQDGLDLLYGDNTATLAVRGSAFYGNSGNQLKWRGLTALIEDNLIIGDCALGFASFPPNNDSSPSYNPSQFVGLYNMDLGDTCRASGNALELSFVPGSHFNVRGNTIASSSGVLVDMSQTGTDGGGTNTAVNFANNIFDGNNNIQWQLFATGGGAETVGGTYDYNVNPPAVETYSHNIFWGVKNGQCPVGSICTDPLLTNDLVTALNPILLPASPAIGNEDASQCPTGLTTCSIGSPTFGGPQVQPPPPTIICTAWTFVLPIQGTTVPAIQCTAYH